MLHQENNIIESTYRELVNNDTKEIQVNSRKLYNYFKKQTFNPKLKKMKTEVTLVSNKKDLFKANNIEKEISKIFHKKVNLKNGSFLLIEEKEGLTVIDVNSGRSLNNKKENNMDGGLIALGAGLGAGLVTIGAALGIGKITAAAAEATGRQPEAAGDIRTTALIMSALIEGVALFCAVTCFLLSGNVAG